MASKHIFLNHTADIAFDIEADSIEELFIEAFKGWLESVAVNKSYQSNNEIELNLISDSLEQLLVDFLNEVNFFLYVKKALCFNIKSLAIDTKKNSIKALMKTILLNDDIILKEEIKSVTYHQMEIKEVKDKYFVRVVFDI